MQIYLCQLLTVSDVIANRVRFSLALTSEAVNERGCLSFIEGTELSLDETTATRRNKSEYTQRQDRALATIYYGIYEQNRTLISSTTSPSKVWIILKEQFEPVSRASVIQLLDEFFSIKFNPDTESITAFIARIRKMVERLKDVGHPLNDPYCAFQAIRTLSLEFQGIVQILYRWPDEDFKLDKIEIELIPEENRLKQLKKCFNDLKNIEGKTMSLAVGGLESPIEGIGTVKFYMKLNGREPSITLKNVTFSPKLRRNLLSAPLLEEANCTFQCENGILRYFAPKGEKLFFAKRFNDLYFLKPKYHLKDVYNNVESSNVKEGNGHYSGNIVLWHNRFCHMNIDYLVQTSKVSAVKGLPKFKKEKLDCESCKLAKTKRVSFKPSGRIRSIRPLTVGTHGRMWSSTCCIMWWS
ncbi:retrovirus-related Pol polyprotein from transposon TNT 1-94 [Trichonephila clavipes]|nr:retrovirus-related Pol polyprotein from transposon TNT 1-94 [Trichonephila clavipes]